MAHAFEGRGREKKLRIQKKIYLMDVINFTKSDFSGLMIKASDSGEIHHPSKKLILKGPQKFSFVG
jgi:hypothetical protein